MSDRPSYGSQPPDAASPGAAEQPAPVKAPPPTVASILEGLRQEGVTDLETLAQRIVEDAGSDSPAHAIFYHDADGAYIYDSGEPVVVMSW